MEKIIVISILNQKGGSGKTTAARTLAYALKLAGKNVLCIDTDPQASLRLWGLNGGSEHVPIIGIDHTATLESTIKDLSKNSNYDTIIIDTKPSVDTHDSNIVNVIDVTDIGIITATPSEDDIKQAAPIIKIIEDKNKLGYKIQPFFLLSRANTKRLTFKAGKELIHHYYSNAPILEYPITNREAYITTFSSGETILHTKDPGLYKERNNIKKLTNQLIEVINAV